MQGEVITVDGLRITVTPKLKFGNVFLFHSLHEDKCLRVSIDKQLIINRAVISW